MSEKTHKMEENSEAKLRAEMARVVTEVLEDPDFGKELSDKAKKRLNKAKDYNGSTTSLSEIKDKYL